MKLSLAVITNKRHTKLHKLLKSAKDAKFDEIIVVETNGGDPDVERVCKQFGANYSTYKDPNQAEFNEFCKSHDLGVPDHFSDFAAARNHAFSLCTGDWIMWADSDDKIVNSFKIREIVDIAERDRKEAIQVYYLYAKDKGGHVISEQWRERIVKNGIGEWFPFLHELYIDHKTHRQFEFHAAPKEIFHVEHDVIDDGSKEAPSDVRNLRILLFHLLKDGKLESRMWKMLGKACRGLGKFLDAIYAYENHIKESGWDMDHFFSYYEMAHCYRMMNMPDAAAECDKKALWIAPQYPQAWQGLAANAIQLRQWGKALTFAEMGIARMEVCGDTTAGVEFNPSGTQRVLYVSQYKALHELGRHQESLVPLTKLARLFPNIADFQEGLEKAHEVMRQGKIGESLKIVLEEAIEERDERKYQSALDSAPQSVKELSTFQFLKRIKPDPTKHSIALICPSQIRFGPSSLKQGVGGSEEAVIHMADALAREGFWVDVFADTLEEGTHGEKGSEYRWYPFAAYKGHQVYDTAIFWRSPQLLAESRIVARNQIVWLHDVGRKDEWPKKSVQNVDKVMVLSEYHRTTVPWIPEDKIIYTRNGIHSDWLSEPKNDPKKVIYASNPTRGLKDLLGVWPDVHQATGAELHLFYGFTEWHKRLVADNPQEQKYIVEIKQLFDRVEKYKVFDHGMVGHKELADWMAQCGVAASPTKFPEISMITAMKYQAMGCVPVITDYAAISETVQFGTKIPWKEGEEYPIALFKEKLIYMINNPGYQDSIRKDMVPWARRVYDWKGVAENLKEVLTLCPSQENMGSYSPEQPIQKISLVTT